MLFPRMGNSPFQLTPSRRATSRKYFYNRSPGISTHALTEGDILGPFSPLASGISTHALTEGDKEGCGDLWIEENFNSRPHGGRQDFFVLGDYCVKISTHALTEGDIDALYDEYIAANFNSRPHGGRRSHPFNRPVLLLISTHALTEGDLINGPLTDFVDISTHALTEGDRIHALQEMSLKSISTHALTEGDYRL